MVNDPLVAALATVLESLLGRGLEVQPCGNGWTVKLAQENRIAATPEKEHRRTW